MSIRPDKRPIANEHDDAPLSVRFEHAEDEIANTSDNSTIGDVIATRFSRRDVLSGLLATTAVAAVLPTAAAMAGPGNTASNTTPSFNFPELQAGVDAKHHVAEGYDADVLIRWGDKVLKDAPDFNPDNQTADAQSRQFGYNNDFVGFVPLDDDGDRGLLCVNHEYTNEELMFPGVPPRQPRSGFNHMTPELVAIEMAAHGGTVIEIIRENGKWRVVPDSVYARRITAQTRMRISGPAAACAAMETTDPDAGARTSVIGMINNCAGAITPWGTWLTCEENFNGYFWNKRARKSVPNTASMKRYSVPGEWYAWGKFHDRFDISKEPNECNRFGWVVEIDPRDPDWVPVKRTALGRFKHEGAGNVINRDGRFVVYQGDDQRFEYIYRFVTDEKVNPENREANLDLLDNGTLYVARFDPDGRGAWLPLVHGQGPLTAHSGFECQGDVVINARMAADLLGATKMDRPEDIEVDPKSGKVYAMLTKNRKRDDDTVDAANPRANNVFGHIIEITPDGGDHTAPTFSWEILVKCGDPSIAEVGATFNPATTANGWFANPDNCAFDADGRLWIATDGNSAESTGRADGIWALETNGDARGTSKLFFQCPIGAEMCGPTLTADMETFFVAVQHPGQGRRGTTSTFAAPTTRWPDFDPGMPPRPAIVAITRKKGGKIAS